MLEIKNQQHYDRVVAFADKKGLRAALDEQLTWLRKFADNEEKGLCVVELGFDFAAASFSLLWKRNGEVWMNGALVYHGDQTGWREDGSYIEPFSVTLSDASELKERPWQVHT